MLARGAAPAQQPSPSSNDDDVVGDEPDGDDDDDDDAFDRKSGFEYTGSAGQHQPQEPPGSAITQRETTFVPEPGIDSPSITHFSQPHAPLEMPPGPVSFFDPHWTGAMGPVQTYPSLPTPGSDDCLSWFDDPFVASTSTVVGNSQPPSSSSWWTKSPMDEQQQQQHCFPNSVPFDLGFQDNMPEDSRRKGSKGPIESTGGNPPTGEGGTEEKGSVTLTLSQVHPDVAQEIMGSVLKHSAGLKIRVHCQ
jgi:hypothetical protein